MSGDIINLRLARKAKARSDKDTKAAENRRLHGRTNADKQSEKRLKERAARDLDGHKRDPSP